MAGELSLRIEEALRRAEQLKDESLQAALRRARDSPDDTRFQLPLLQLPQGGDDDQAATVQSGARRADRKVMCPEMYRAAISGSVQKMQGLLPPSGAAVDQHERWHRDQCSVDEVAAGWNTALHLAAGEGQAADLVEHLLQGAAAATLLPSENARSEAALHVAARAGHQDVVSLILKVAQAEEGPGAPWVLLRKDSRGDTAMHVAARQGRQAVVQVLMVAAPALSGAVNNAGMSPLYLAVMNRSVGTVKALIYRDNGAASPPTARWEHTSASGPKMQNALHAAVLQSVDITSHILSWKPDLARQGDESGSTPLHCAASDGNPSIVRLLVTTSPLAAYEQDREGFTPLHIAAWMGHVQVIREILEACPDAAELVDRKARNFLHLAVERGQESVVRYVVGSPFLARMINEQDRDGNTPLYSAVMVGNPNLAILDSGVIELNIADDEGRTPFDLASKINSFLFMIATVLKLSAGGARFGQLRQDDITPWKSKETTTSSTPATTDTTTQDARRNGDNGAEGTATTTDNTGTAHHASRRNAVAGTNGAAIKDWLDKASKNLGIVSVLIATVGLSAMFNVPGGYDSSGAANLRGTVSYKTFVVLDTAAVAASVVATMLLTYGRSVRFSAVWLFLALIFLWVALMSMILAFMAAVVSGLDSAITKVIIWAIFLMPFAFLVGLSVVWPVPAPTFTSLCLLLRAFTSKDSQQMRRRVGRRFPLVGSYLLALYMFWFLNVAAFSATLYVIINTIS